MAFTDETFRGVMLIQLNGAHPSAPLVRCAVCGQPKLRVFTTAATRAVAPSLPVRDDVCINTKWIGGIACPSAMASAGVMTAIMDASRAP